MYPLLYFGGIECIEIYRNISLEYLEKVSRLLIFQFFQGTLNSTFFPSALEN